MGGKRPDQYQIDPGEAGATDYKSVRDSASNQEEGKHKLAQQESHIPERGENPALADLKAKREAKAEEEAGDKKNNVDPKSGTDEQPA